VQEGEAKAATATAASDASEATPMETTSPDKKETKAETAGGGVQKTGHTPSTSSGVGALQLPPSEGNVATASAAALAAAAVKAKVRRREREGGNN
jgi:hypothetical protein